MIRHGLAIFGLTVLTQVGGLAWLLALLLRPVGRFWILFLVFYVGLSTAAYFTAPQMGRTALPCLDAGPAHIAVLNPVYCALNRHYVSPEIKAHGDALAAHMHEVYPGTRTRALDGNFPFLDGFPLLPHLSHDDGNGVDLAFYYTDAAGDYQLAKARSPIGYFGFEQPGGASQCPDNTVDLRWDLDWLQPYLRDWSLDDARTATALQWLADNPTGTNYKIFVEPYLADRLGVQSPAIRFQGCKAARHDDHLHLEFQP